MRSRPASATPAVWRSQEPRAKSQQGEARGRTSFSLLPLGKLILQVPPHEAPPQYSVSFVIRPARRRAKGSGKKWSAHLLSDTQVFRRAGRRGGGACLCAGGTSENSPTFQRWVCVRNALSPDRDGRRPNQDACSIPLQPSLSGLRAFRRSFPTLKRWAIAACPSGTKNARWREPTGASDAGGVEPRTPSSVAACIL
jgi:hypothetical protein